MSGILRGFDEFGTIPTENDTYEILIRNSSGVVIASILWKIAFNADAQSSLRIGETFRVNFTDQGTVSIRPFIRGNLSAILNHIKSHLTLYLRHLRPGYCT